MDVWWRLIVLLMGIGFAVSSYNTRLQADLIVTLSHRIDLLQQIVEREHRGRQDTARYVIPEDHF